MGEYERARRTAAQDPSQFWLAQADAIEWTVPPTIGLDDSQAPIYRWFPDGELNTCANALDRHVAAGRGDRVAIQYDSPLTGSARAITSHACAQRWRECAPMRRSIS